MIEIGPVVIEIWGVENGDLAVPINNSLVGNSISVYQGFSHDPLRIWQNLVCE